MKPLLVLVVCLLAVWQEPAVLLAFGGLVAFILAVLWAIDKFTDLRW